ncbi:MAG: hypothetical protein J5642_04380 [Bacteroidales bacterium]|nr:hypothetical protein [Bacteroidales bacterium]
METENLHQNTQFLRWCERLNLQSVPSPGIQQQMMDLTQELTRHSHTDREKSEAIYSWMVKNVEYDFGLRMKVELYISSYNLYDGTHGDDIRILTRALLAAGPTVFEKRRGICSNIAHLYKQLCNMVGVECKVVIGLSWGEGGLDGHVWNIVRLDGSDHMVDVTGGIANQSDRFFDVHPLSMFLAGYFPIHLEDQCVQPPMTYRQYARWVTKSASHRFSLWKRLRLKHLLIKRMNLYRDFFVNISCSY